MDDTSSPSADTTDSALRHVADLVRRLHRTQMRVSQLEADLKDANAEKRDLSERQLPRAMAECDMVAPTKMVISGLTVNLAEKYRCGQLESPPSANRRRDDNDAPRAKDPAAAFAWIEAEGHGDLEKRQIVVTLGRDSEATADELVETIRRHPAANSFELMHKRIIPWNTLAGFAAEQVEQGYDPPLELLGIQRVVQARVGVPKEKV